MAFGLEVQNNYGTFLIAPQFPNYGILEKGTSGATKTLPNVDNIVVLGKTKWSSDYDSMLPGSVWTSEGQKYAILAPIKDIPYKKSYGLETYSSTGELEFTSEVQYAYIHNVQTINLYTFMSHVPHSSGAYNYSETISLPYYPSNVELYVVVSSCINIGNGDFIDNLSSTYVYDLPFWYTLNAVGGVASITIGVNLPDEMINYRLSMTQLVLTTFAVYL